MYYFYVLESQTDRKHYYGSTNDLRRRVEEHQQGNVSSTKHRRPLVLMYYEACQTLEQARVREQQVKTSGSVRKALHMRINLIPKESMGQPGLP